MHLAARGATATATADLAQAVAERVLAGRGIATAGWQPIEARDDLGAFWATADPRGPWRCELRAGHGP